MNKRQLRLKNMIDSGGTPLIINATFISGIGDIPFHWGDLEKIGYGYTKRAFNVHGDKIAIDRYYTGPNEIHLTDHGKMKKGDVHIGEK